MPHPANRPLTGPGPLLPAFVVAIALLGAAAPAPADELPAFRQGLWEFKRTVNGQTLVSRTCGNPTETMRAQNAQLERAGCRFSPVAKSANAYTFSSECAMKMPGGGTVTSATMSVLTVESDSAYRLQVTGTAAGAPTDEVMVARRAGDCTK
jgi:hypothetical protein